MRREREVQVEKKKAAKQLTAKLKDAERIIKHKDQVIKVSLISLSLFVQNKYSHIIPTFAKNIHICKTFLYSQMAN